ncbi:CehA/McbA family metallohydrolase [Aminipila sp.]|uniref:CehA/McbA family metallohydrolase n=1 Tax=Aminipila sp. TaxID=2060095 RepID=UPI00289CE2B7|nr:CehA/McbA family metallohydrolase [Aminipila sp.]
MKFRVGLMLTMGLLGAMLLFATPVFAAEGGVVKGTTPIDQGMANDAKDITIYNSKIAASFAVGSSNYWNMTKGSILDVAKIKGKTSAGDPIFGVDLVNDVEFLNNYWTATAAYKGTDLLEDDVKVSYKVNATNIEVVAKTRYYKEGHDKPLDVTTKYILEDGKDYIQMVTTMKNPVDNQAYEAMNAGYSISTLAANMYGPFGWYPDTKVTGIRVGNDSRVKEPLANFVATYGQESYNSTYCVSVELDDADTYKGSSGYKDIYKRVTIAGGQTVTFNGEMLVSDTASTTPIVERDIQKFAMKADTISGKAVDNEGKPVENAFVIIYKSGSYVANDDKAVVKIESAPLAWAMTNAKGEYSFKLPDGTYSIHAESLGSTPSNAQAVVVKDGTADNKNLNFALQAGAHATLKVTDQTGKNIPARIEVKSSAPTDIKMLGSSVYFTNLVNGEYVADFDVPAGTISFTASYGADYESKKVTVSDVKITSGEKYVNTKDLVIKEIINPRLKNWYNMDNHQHSSIGDGATPIDQLFIAQICAKLDFNLVSDHDSVKNDAEMVKLAGSVGRSVVPSLEVSPGWGHWGILNVDYSKAETEATPISASLKPGQIIAKGHNMNAVVVVNHPYTDYGFFLNRDGVIGGHDKGTNDFDLIELQSTLDLADAKNMDAKALTDAMNVYWNKGQKKFLSAGSDQHDVKSGLYPGIIRMYAHINGDVNADAYLAALTSGHAYATMGPLFTLDESVMFGETYNVAKEKAFTFKSSVQAVNTLKRIDVYSMGKVVASYNYDTAEPVDFTYEMKNIGTKNLWYSFVAVDGAGHYAVTNPIWIDDFTASNAAVSRAQFVEMLYTLSGQKFTEIDAAFKDVALDSSYAQAVAWAKKNSIVNGTTTVNFSPNASITREQMVTILYNYAKVMGKDVSNIEGMAIQNFEDWTNTSAYAKTAVRWAFNQKIILGESSTILGPKDTATRAQASIIISRVN